MLTAGHHNLARKGYQGERSVWGQNVSTNVLTTPPRALPLSLPLPTTKVFTHYDILQSQLLLLERFIREPTDYTG